MKALRVEQFGPLANLQISQVLDAPLPAGYVRIEIEAAGVNPSDTGVALGHFPQVTLPRILGRDFAGRVIEGPQDTIGTKVWGSGGGISNGGTLTVNNLRAPLQAGDTFVLFSKSHVSL